jgi:hypothetical protein
MGGKNGTPSSRKKVLKMVSEVSDGLSASIGPALYVEVMGKQGDKVLHRRLWLRGRSSDGGVSGRDPSSLG